MKKVIIFLSLLLVPFVSSASIDANLSYGLENNSQVKELQEFLISKQLLTGSATGNFYDLTLSAVKKYQASMGLPQSGYVGPLTRKAINDERESLPASSQKPQNTQTDLVASLRAQIAQLQQQIKDLLAQQVAQQKATDNAIQKIQENTDKIAQNTTPAPTPKPSVIFTDAYNFKTQGDEFSIVSFAYNQKSNFGIPTFYISSDKRPREVLFTSGNRKSCRDYPDVYGCSNGIEGIWVAFPSMLIPEGAKVTLDIQGAEILGITLEGAKSRNAFSY